MTRTTATLALPYKPRGRLITALPKSTHRQHHTDSDDTSSGLVQQLECPSQPRTDKAAFTELPIRSTTRRTISLSNMAARATRQRRFAIVGAFGNLSRHKGRRGTIQPQTSKITHIRRGRILLVTEDTSTTHLEIMFKAMPFNSSNSRSKHTWSVASKPMAALATTHALKRCTNSTDVSAVSLGDANTSTICVARSTGGKQKKAVPLPCPLVRTSQHDCML